MAETVTIDRPSVAKPVSRPQSTKRATVSAKRCTSIAAGPTSTSFEAAVVIRQHGDGFPLDQSRCLSEISGRERPQSPRSEVDADFQR